MTADELLDEALIPLDERAGETGLDIFEYLKKYLWKDYHTTLNQITNVTATRLSREEQKQQKRVLKKPHKHMAIAGAIIGGILSTKVIPGLSTPITIVAGTAIGLGAQVTLNTVDLLESKQIVYYRFHFFTDEQTIIADIIFGINKKDKIDDITNRIMVNINRYK